MSLILFHELDVELVDDRLLPQVRDERRLVQWWGARGLGIIGQGVEPGRAPRLIDRVDGYLEAVRHQHLPWEAWGGGDGGLGPVREDQVAALLQLLQAPCCDVLVTCDNITSLVYKEE